MQKTIVLLLTIIVVTAAFVTSATSYAGYRNFEAPLDKANWDLNGSPIQCSLSQDIPHYGVATFTSGASRQANLNFDLSSRRYHATTKTKVIQANLSSEPPIWKHDQSRVPMGQVPLFPGTYPINIKNSDAWSLLTELERGMFPTFTYDSFLENNDKMFVALSAVNFQPVYDEFLNCVAELLPYSFDDIAETFVYFEFNRSDFTRETRESLARIGAWLEIDKTMELVLLAGHTDSKGQFKYNQKLGKRRADAVKKFFVSAGISANKIKTQSFAANQPNSSNATPEGRAKNRRVMIKMVR